MTIYNVLLTMLGGFLLPFLILLAWGKLVQRFNAFGGWLAALAIIAPLWLFNHGISRPLIYQNSQVFIDMGFSVGVGLLVYSLATKDKLINYKRNLPAAIIGGILAGSLLFII